MFQPGLPDDTTMTTAPPEARSTAVRRLALRVTPLRSVYHLLLWLQSMVRSDRASVERQVTASFTQGADPWRYTEPAQQARHAFALSMLDGRLQGKPARRALEIGCAEGLFTRLLAARCESLLAVDLSTQALARAERAVSESGAHNVTFRQWDLLQGDCAETFDLVVADHVLDYFRRPSMLRQARRNIVRLVAQGGLLLVGTLRHGDFIETRWWARTLRAGGKHVNAFIGEAPELESLCTETAQGTVYSLFRRKPNSASSASKPPQA
jgi:2-polyprenyl-3-methyl-5-hydroxy-6-metoxy-1,4-benzoquinol methylase